MDDATTICPIHRQPSLGGDEARQASQASTGARAYYSNACGSWHVSTRRGGGAQQRRRERREAARGGQS